MKKAMAAALAASLVASSAIGTGASAAQRDNPKRDQFIQNYCSRHDDNDCRDWRSNRHRWDEARYRYWYERHRHDRDFGPVDAAAVVFGFAAGTAAAIVTGAITTTHV